MTRSFTYPELAARAWAAWSRFPDERAVAARRFREVVDGDALYVRSLTRTRDMELVLQAIGELAVEGYHARAILAAPMRDRVARLRETVPAADGRAS